MPAANASSVAGGGSTSGSQSAGAAGSGQGNAQGDQNSLMGGDFGANRAIAMKVPAVVMGNIKPYKIDLLSRIKKTWNVNQPFLPVTLEVVIDHNGKLVSRDLIDGTGNPQLDQSLLQAVDNTEYAPLPDWYKSEHLRFKLILNSSQG